MQQEKKEKKTIFCLCPLGNAIKLNFNNSNKKMGSFSKHLKIAGATISFVS